MGLGKVELFWQKFEGRALHYLHVLAARPNEASRFALYLVADYQLLRTFLRIVSGVRVNTLPGVLRDAALRARIVEAVGASFGPRLRDSLAEDVLFCLSWGEQDDTQAEMARAWRGLMRV